MSYPFNISKKKLLNELINKTKELLINVDETEKFYSYKSLFKCCLILIKSIFASIKNK